MDLHLEQEYELSFKLVHVRMKRIITIGFLMMTLGLSAQSKKKKRSADVYETDISAICEGVGSEGTQLFKVYFIFKKEKKARMYAQKNALKTVLFQGIPTGNGCIEKGLVSADEYQKHSEWFANFFSENGSYLNYVNLVGNSMIERVRMPKKTFRAAWIVSVNHANLRELLEKEKIIKPLDDGF
jgi:hypothetical protein